MPAHLLAHLPAPRRLRPLAMPQLPPHRPMGPVDTMTTPRRTLDLAMTEAQWQATIVCLAHNLGYLVYHTHDSRRSPAGFPDLVLCGRQLIFAEVKAERGKITIEQSAWLQSLRDAGAQAYLWRPSDYPEVERTLTRRDAP